MRQSLMDTIICTVFKFSPVDSVAKYKHVFDTDAHGEEGQPRVES